MACTPVGPSAVTRGEEGIGALEPSVGSCVCARRLPAGCACGGMGQESGVADGHCTSAGAGLGSGEGRVGSAWGRRSMVGEHCSEIAGGAFHKRRRRFRLMRVRQDVTGKVSGHVFINLQIFLNIIQVIDD